MNSGRFPKYLATRKSRKKYSEQITKLSVNNISSWLRRAAILCVLKSCEANSSNGKGTVCSRLEKRRILYNRNSTSGLRDNILGGSSPAKLSSGTSCESDCIANARI